jgi:hypothetical protein
VDQETNSVNILRHLEKRHMALREMSKQGVYVSKTLTLNAARDVTIRSKYLSCVEGIINLVNNHAEDVFSYAQELGMERFEEDRKLDLSNLQDLELLWLVGSEWYTCCLRTQLSTFRLLVVGLMELVRDDVYMAFSPNGGVE